MNGVARELAHERHLKAIALWSCLAGGVVALVGAAALLSAIGGDGARAQSAAISGLVVCSMGVGHVVSGVGLLRFRSWARWLGVVLAGLAFATAGYGAVVLVGAMAASIFPATAISKTAFSLLWNGATAWALANPRAGTICHPDYVFVVHRDRRPRRTWTSPFFWGPLVGMLVQVVVALTAR
jgi:hypothetical protein